MIAIIGYSTYLAVAVFLVAIVGRKLHRDGGVWLDDLFNGSPLAARLNDLLLTGYCLVNIGQAFWTMTFWDHAHHPLLEAACKTGTNMLILGWLHLQNIIAIHSYHHLNSINNGSHHQ